MGEVGEKPGMGGMGERREVETTEVITTNILPILPYSQPRD